MSSGQLGWIVNFIWGIADDVLRDLYVRGKYRDVILPMIVLRRLDAVLEPTKQAVLGMKTSLDQAGIVHQDQALHRPLARRSTTPRSSRCGTCGPGRANSNCELILRLTSMASRRTSRTSWKTSSSATKSRGSPEPTRWAR